MKKLEQLRIGNYFRELSVVIIGVAVTLYVSGLINNAKEQKDLQGQMEAIHSELEYNLHLFEELIEYYDKVDGLSKFLEAYAHNPIQANADSINRYGNIFGKIYSLVYQQGAYDMFWNSGNAKLFKDKELLLDIANCYAMIERAANVHSEYTKLKMDKLAALYNLDTYLIIGQVDWTKPQFRSVFNFHLVANGSKYSALEARERIENILSKMKHK